MINKIDFNTINQFILYSCTFQQGSKINLISFVSSESNEILIVEVESSIRICLFIPADCTSDEHYTTDKGTQRSM